MLEDEEIENININEERPFIQLEIPEYDYENGDNKEDNLEEPKRVIIIDL